MTSPPQHQIVSLDLSPSEMDYEAWSVGQCVYRCDICESVFQHSLDFYSHISRDYQLTPERYKDKHGSALLRKKMIECEVPGCHERIAHDFGKVGAHFSRVHPTIGLREYYEKYVTKIKNIKKEAGEHFYGDVAPGKRPHDVHSILAPNAKKRKKSPELKGEVLRPSDLPWTIRASFKCRVCADVVWGKERLKKHYNVRHKETALKEHEDMVHAQMFSCSLCKLKVVYDTFEIAVHLAMHDMNVDEYADMFEQYLPKSNINLSLSSVKGFPSNAKGSSSSAKVFTKLNEPPSSAKRFLPLGAKGFSVSGKGVPLSTTRFSASVNGVSSSAKGSPTRDKGVCNSADEVPIRAKGASTSAKRGSASVNRVFASAKGFHGFSDIEHETAAISVSPALASTQVIPDFLADTETVQGKDKKLPKMPFSAITATPSKSKLPKKPKPVNTSIPSKVWYDGSLFGCEECEEIFSNEKDAREHVRISNHGTYNAVPAGRDNCGICHTELQWNRKGLKKHFDEKHGGMTFEEYEEKYIHAQSQNTNPGMTTAASSGVTESQLKNSKVKQKSEKAKVVQMTTVASSNGQSKDTPKEQGTHDTAIEGRAMCTICDADLQSSRCNLKKHFQRKHIGSGSMTFEEYEEKHVRAKTPDCKRDITSVTEVKCSICNMEKSRSNLKKHFEQKHGGMTFAQYEDQYVKSTETSELKCTICDTEQSSRISMKRHFHKKHGGMTFEQYKEEYVLPMKRGDDQKTTPAASGSVTKSTCKKSQNRKKSVKTNQNQKTVAASKNANSTEIPEVQKVTVNGKERWSDKCLYRCGSCAYTAVNTDMVGKHTKKYKHTPYTAVSTPMYDCKVCSQSLLWSNRNIKNHVKKIHKLTIEQYEKIHEETQENENEPENFESDEEVQENEHQQVNVEPFEEAEENESEQVNVELQAKNILRSENQMKEDTWFDMCTFKCNHCHATFRSYHAIRQHNSKQKHKGHTKIVSEIYSCKMCDSSVLWQRESIRAHLHKKHQGLALKEYFQMFEALDSSTLDLASDRTDKESHADELETPAEETDDILASAHDTEGPQDELEAELDAAISRKLSGLLSSSSSDVESPLCRITEVQGAVEDVFILPTCTAKCPLSDICPPISNLDEFSTHLSEEHAMVESGSRRHMINQMRSNLCL